jgi:hypothetical protein
MLGGKMKKQVVRLLGEEEYEIISELLNGQLEQMEQTLELSGIEYQEQEKFDPKVLEKAMDNGEMGDVTEAVANDFNNKMKTLQVKVLREHEVTDEQIKGKFL